jgi:hypothetical protein
MRRAMQARSIGLLLGAALVLAACAAGATAYAPVDPCPPGAVCDSPDPYGSLELDGDWGWGGWDGDFGHRGWDGGFHRGFSHDGHLAHGSFGHGGLGGHGGGHR